MQVEWYGEAKSELLRENHYPNHHEPHIVSPEIVRWSYYLLTYSMEQSPSWEANWFAASQEFPRVLWNPKVHHRTHKHLPPIPILSQPNPVHTPTSHFLKVHPNTSIILPSTPGPLQRSLSLRFPHQIPVHTSRWFYCSIELFWTQANKVYAPVHMTLILCLKYNKRV
jgi:hypothetical protein